MSEQSTEVEAVELPVYGDAAFATLMDALAPEQDSAQVPPGTGQAAPANGAAGVPAGGVPAAGTPALPTAGDGPATPAAGGGDPVRGADGSGQPAAGAGTDAGTGATTGTGDGAAGARPADWTATAAETIPKLAELTTILETKTAQAYQTQALEEVQGEHGQYFEALQRHPRTMVGMEVPSLEGEGMEVLRDTDDAKEWQDAVKSILVEEVQDRATKAMDENAGFLDTLTASIELFTKNTDLIPGTVEFDVDLANRFTAMATPYELRVDGKLQGYSIPVQPIVDQLRTQLAGERAAAGTNPPGQAAATPPPAKAAAGGGTPPATPAAAPPQAGIESKAGSGAEVEDFSALFGTIGLPNLRI